MAEESNETRYHFRTKTEVTYKLAEHEILLAFDDDEGACCFMAWWLLNGQTAFDRFSKTYQPHQP